MIESNTPDIKTIHKEMLALARKLWEEDRIVLKIISFDWQEHLECGETRMNLLGVDIDTAIKRS